ncbi:MAG: choice-of-anchor tandem repeat GloVer-containing protein [Pseudomonadota bacterium]
MPLDFLRRVSARHGWLAGALLALMLAAAPGWADEVTVEVVHPMSLLDGANIRGPLVAGADGLHYGTAVRGGRHDLGTVFRILADGRLEVLHHFRGAPDDGDRPVGLARGADGALYGLTLAGGAFGDGTAYRVDTNGKLKLLHSFESAVDGRSPQGQLLLASDGRFYGATDSGGSDDQGTIFRMRPNGQVQTLHSFAFSDGGGRSPTGSLVEGDDGLLYGTTNSGGPEGYGIVFKMRRHGGSPPEMLHNFGRKDRNGTVLKALTKGPDGRFYGVIQADRTDNPRGLVYRIDAAGHYEVFYSFTRPVEAHGKSPFQELVLGRDGAFYGSTTQGGEFTRGTLFRLTLDGELTTLHSFQSQGEEGWFASNPLVEVIDGEFLGATASGSTGNQGAVYCLRITPALRAPTR